MAVVAAMMSTIITATTPPMMAEVLSELDAELAVSEGAAVCGDGVAIFPGRTGAVKNSEIDV